MGLRSILTLVGLMVATTMIAYRLGLLTILDIGKDDYDANPAVEVEMNGINNSNGCMQCINSHYYVRKGQNCYYRRPGMRVQDWKLIGIACQQTS